MPSWFLPLWVFLLPIQINIKGVRVNFAPADVLLVVYVFHLLGRGWSSIRESWHNSITWLAISVILLGNAVFFFTTGTTSTWAIVQKSVGFLALMLGYVMVSEYASQGWERVEHLTRWFVRVVTAHAIGGILNFFLHLQSRWFPKVGSSGRLSGYYLDPNAFGGLLATAFVIALVIYFRKGRLYRPIEGAVSASALAIATFLTYSRSCWIGLVAGTVLGFLVGRVRHRLVSVAVVIALGVMVYFAVPRVIKEDTGESETTGWQSTEVLVFRERSVDQRVDIIKEAVTMFWQSPIWGKGLGYFLYKNGNQLLIHNTFFWILAELGLIGALFFIWFILGHFRRSLSSIRHGPDRALSTSIGLMCGFAAMASFSLGIEALYQRHWWLLGGLISAGYVIAKRELAAAAVLRQRPARERAVRVAGARPAPQAGPPVMRPLPSRAKPWGQTE